MNREERAKRWARHVEGWKASGLTQRAYCERESISWDTFRRWVVRLGRERGAADRPAGFVAVRVGVGSGGQRRRAQARGAETAGALAREVEVRLANGRSMQLGGPFAEADLGRLIRLLERLPC